MSRSGVEAKLPWRAAPDTVRRATEELLGAKIARAARVWGGYGPTPTYRLLLADGRRAFFKGTDPTSNDVMRYALEREERMYRELPDLIGRWAPAFYGAFARDGWRALLLEDVGPRSAPPWTPALTRSVAYEYAAFHARTLGCDPPDWLDRPPQSLSRVTWERVVADSDELCEVANLATGQEEAALRWLRDSTPLFTRLSTAAPEIGGPYALLHGDTRSDNLRYAHGRLILFDWPWAEVGRPEFDLVPFAQSVTVEGGVHPEQVLTWYAERLAVRPEAIDAAVAWFVAFFAGQAWRPEIPGLPRLRRFQRQQLAVMLAWAARRFNLPEPGWLHAIDA